MNIDRLSHNSEYPLLNGPEFNGFKSEVKDYQLISNFFAAKRSDTVKSEGSSCHFRNHLFLPAMIGFITVLPWFCSTNCESLDELISQYAFTIFTVLGLLAFHCYSYDAIKSDYKDIQLYNIDLCEVDTHHGKLVYDFKQYLRENNKADMDPNSRGFLSNLFDKKPLE